MTEEKKIPGSPGAVQLEDAATAAGDRNAGRTDNTGDGHAVTGAVTDAATAAGDRAPAQLARLGTAALAYMGDAVYEVYIRQHVIESGLARADRLHGASVKFVRAAGQAGALRAMLEEGFLTDEEAALVRRARNHKVSTKPKNADVVEYKMATAFEALVGFLYLSGNEPRLKEVMERAVAITQKGL